MTVVSERIEPVIAFGSPKPDPAAPVRQVLSVPARHAPSGHLTRSIRRMQDDVRFDALARSMALPEELAEVFASALHDVAAGQDDGDRVAVALNHLFDFEPVAGATSQPLILVGGDVEIRRRVTLAMGQRLEWEGRRVALYCLRNRRLPTPLAVSSGGLDILYVGSVEACIDAVKARDPGELALVDASCLDGHEGETNALAMLSLALDGEALYVADGQTPFPTGEHPAIERLILAGRYDAQRAGAVLGLVHRTGWAFAGQYSPTGLYRPLTPELLAERLAFYTP